MKCEDTKLLLLDFLYDEIAREDEKRVREHLDICSACRNEYEALQRTSLTLRAWPDEEPQQNFVFVEIARVGAPRSSKCSFPSRHHCGAVWALGWAWPWSQHCS